MQPQAQIESAALGNTLSCMDLSDAPTMMRQLPASFKHFNAIDPHPSLKIKVTSGI
jgi:hypothetical protein